MEDISVLNQRLKDIFGTLIDGRPRWRLVFTTEQFEIRKDNYKVFYGDLYLRTEENVVKEVPKYPFSPDRYVLEYHTYIHPKNILTFNGSYEPVHVFSDPRDGSYLYPNWFVLNFIVNAWEGRVSENFTPSDLKEQEAKEIAAEIAQDELSIAEEGRADLFAFEQSTVLDKTDFWRK